MKKTTGFVAGVMLLFLLLVGMHWGMYGILCGMIVSELNINRIYLTLTTAAIVFTAV